MSLDNSREVSFKKFYREYSRSFWLYICKICGDENMADDIFQEAFYKFLKIKPVISNEKHQKSYLYKIAFNLIIDKKRKIKVENRAFLEEKEAYKKNQNEPGRVYKTHLSMDMEKTFKLLKPKTRTLLWLSYVEGYKSNEIADITGSKENSIKVQLFRARKKLAGLLEEKDYRWGEQI